MSVVDLTGKLGLSEKPKIKIGDVELTVNTSASSILQLMALSSKEMGAQEILQATDLLFDAKSKKTLDKLDLSLNDLTVVLETAMTLVVGETEGEAETLDTTS